MPEVRTTDPQQSDFVPSQSSAGRKETPIVAPNQAVRPFHIDVPEADLLELKRRIRATRWPERETVSDESQGVKLKTIGLLPVSWTPR